MTTMPLVPPTATEALRPFGVHNETVLHAVELDASSHEDAVKRYRDTYQPAGYACIRTSDAEVFFALREGQLHKVHHTDLRTHPLTQAQA
jgi:hypothetical protein